jgi:GntR family transcriptional regulator
MDFQPKQGIYLQLADQVCEGILRQTWREGERLPSIRELAVSAELNPNTVARTYAHLQALGIIGAERGTGYSVATGAVAAIRRQRRQAFLNQELPELFKTMRLLDIAWDDVRREYERHAAGATAGDHTQTH